MNRQEQVIPVDKVPFVLLAAAYARAADRWPENVAAFDIRIAGFRLRVEVVGRVLAETIRRAFSHLIVSAGERADLTINVWDETETGIAVADQYSSQRRRDDDVEILLKISEDGRYVCEQRDLSVSWLDTETSRIVSCISSASFQYLDERARPFHKLISAWLDERGVQFVHAGLIEWDGTGVLFVGNGGAGKSTSSVACLRAGMGYLGDDFVGIQMHDGACRGHGFFSSCLLNVHHLRRFPDLKPHAVPAHQDFEDKSILFLHEVFPDSLRGTVDIGAIMMPRIVDREESSYRPASKAEALFAIAPTSVMFLPRPSQKAFDRVTDLVLGLPTYWLELGRDIDGIPDAVKALIGSVGRRCRT